MRRSIIHRNDSTVQEKIPQKLRERIKILVVEDNLLNQKLADFILNDWGIQHTLCSNGQLALDAFEKEKYDLILMDIQMPVMNGTEATKIIRNKLGSDVPIIAMTAHALPGEKEKCIQAGMTAYMTKPIHEEDLHDMIVKYLLSPTDNV